MLTESKLAAAIPLLLEGIDAREVHVFFSGLYTSFTSTLTVGEIPATLPPITYNFPLTTDEAAWCLAVSIGAFVIHVLDEGSYASFVVRMPDREDDEDE